MLQYVNAEMILYFQLIFLNFFGTSLRLGLHHEPAAKKRKLP